MPKPIRVLHLSDFHFRAKSNWDAEPVLIELGGAIRELVDAGLAPDMIVLSGDLAFSGQRTEFLSAAKWIDKVLLKSLRGFDKKNLFIVPGNHDVDRSKVTTGVKAIEDHCRKSGQEEITEVLTGSDKKAVLNRHKEYLAFANRYRPSSTKLNSIWWAEKRRFGPVAVGIAGIASSLISSGDEDYGKLIVSRYQLNQVFGKLNDVDICIGIIHHPFGYIHEVDQNEVETRIMQRCSILLRGHLHRKKSVLHKSPDHAVLELATGSSYAGSDYPNAFQLIELDTVASRVRVYYRRWQDGEWIADLTAYKATNKGIGTFLLRVFKKTTRRKKPKRKVGKGFKYPSATDTISGTLLWARTLPRLPITRSIIMEMSEVLSSVRTKAYNYLRRQNAGLLNKQVRANIFLADYRQAKDGFAYLLYMPDELRIKMDHSPEWHLKFRPGQGTTGMVFNEGNQRLARRLSKKAGEWEAVLPLTKDQKSDAHKDLTWILSYPLRDPVSRETLGVLNIDGLTHEFDDGALTEMMLSLSPEILAIEVLLAKQPKIRVACEAKGT
jgi:predicted MPP superfamily phosphohydrolase